MSRVAAGLLPTYYLADTVPEVTPGYWRYDDAEILSDSVCDRLFVFLWSVS